MSRFIAQPNRDQVRIYLQLQLFLATILVTLRKEVPKLIHQTLQQRVNQGNARQILIMNSTCAQNFCKKIILILTNVIKVEKNGKEHGSQKLQQKILFISQNYQKDFSNCQRKLKSQSPYQKYLNRKKPKKLPKNQKKLSK